MKEQEALQKAKLEEGKIEESLDMEQMDIKSNPSTMPVNDDVSSDEENEEMDIGESME